MSRPRKTMIEYRNYELPLNFPVLVLTGEEWYISEVRSGKLHFHNCLEIGICHSDNGFLEFGEEKVPFKEGDVTVISRNVPHTTYSAKGKSSLWSYIYINPDALLKGLYGGASPYSELYSDMIQNVQLVLSREKNSDIYYIVKQILREMVEKEMNYQISVKGLFLALFMKLLRVYSEIRNKKTPDEQSHENAIVIAPALEYIRENYMTEFGIEDLSNMCHLSQTHFRRIFNEIMNTSPLDYLNTIRILQACILLRTTEDSILSVSEQVGFRSVSSFNRHFSDKMGSQPSEWRKRMVKIDNASIMKYTGWTRAEKLSEST
ncbi:MAG: AraC family transcriptional regulator [Lachnospiraceae bacterium]|nr:AraC family transcriptional regulator [Lachnospiraceae bacterium]